MTETGQTQLATRKRLAAKVFRHTAAYDALIADYLTKVEESEPEKLTLTYELKQTLRYGENSHQTAAFIKMHCQFLIRSLVQNNFTAKNCPTTTSKMRMPLCESQKEFTEPTAVALKHMNPCGIGTATTIFDAFERAYEADPVSILEESSY